MAIEDYEAFRASETLWKVISPILLVFGTTGNILVITVLTRRRSRALPTSVFLSALALSDMLALHTGLLRQWMKYTFDVDVRTDVSVAGCRLHWFIVYTATQFSSWMLICVTSERLASTLLVHRRRKICTVKTSVVFVVVILVFLVTLNAHYLFGYGHKYTTDISGRTVYSRCVPLTKDYEKFTLYSWTWIDLCVFYLIPMIVLVTGNSLIIYNVIRSHRKALRSVAPHYETGSTCTTTRTVNKHQKTRISGLTLSLMLVSVVFFICITPIVVYPIGQPYWSEGATDRKLASLFLVETLANLFMYINHSINFVLYFLSGSRFRNDVKQLFCKRNISNEVEISVIQNTPANQGAQFKTTISRSS